MSDKASVIQVVPPLPGSTPFGADAQAAWLGHPAQAAEEPAWSLAVPGQSGKNKSGGL